MELTVLSESQHSARLPIEDMNRIIDLDRYPLHRLDDAQGQYLVTQCQQDLDKNSASLLHDFIRPEAIERMSAEATGLIPTSYRHAGKPRQTYPDPDQAAKDDPVAQSVRAMKQKKNSNNQVLNYQIPNNSDFRVMFLWPELKEFVRRVLRVNTHHQSQCPHLGLTYKIAFESESRKSVRYGILSRYLFIDKHQSLKQPRFQMNRSMVSSSRWTGDVHSKF